MNLEEIFDAGFKTVRNCENRSWRQNSNGNLPCLMHRGFLNFSHGYLLLVLLPFVASLTQRLSFRPCQLTHQGPLCLANSFSIALKVPFANKMLALYRIRIPDRTNSRYEIDKFTSLLVGESHKAFEFSSLQLYFHKIKTSLYYRNPVIMDF